MYLKRVLTLAFALLFLAAPALAEGFEPLPMDTLDFGAAPKNENYISETEYVDDSISVKIYDGRYADTDYCYAHVKISHPSQLRTTPASVVTAPTKANFRSSNTQRGRYIARAVNAVVAINGDYFTKSDKCRVVLRQSTQERNIANGKSDLLIVDKDGNFSALKMPGKDDYTAYYKANKDNLYQVFCFGPVLVENGASIIPADYENSKIGGRNNTQRSAIAQLGPLEYVLITCNGPQSENSKGMTIYEFATVCETVGKELNGTGCLLAYNLDGGNSSTMLFKSVDNEYNKLLYSKYNCPEIERFLSDIIYFATLEK